MLWGRGFRWMYYATGMPGWMRACLGYLALGRGTLFWLCRRFPMPRWWWAGIYGPMEWVPQRPILSSQTTAQMPVTPIQFRLTKDQEIQFLEQEIKALEEERKVLDQELESIKNRLNELKSKNN